MVCRCGACGGRTTREPWGAHVCSECHSIFSSTLPDPTDLQRYYAEFNVTYHGGGRASGANDRQKRYALEYLLLVKRYCRTGSLLDVGSSTNPFPNYATRDGFKVTVLDYVRPSGLLPNIEFIEGTAVQNAKLNGRFNVVTAFAVLEHFLDISGSIKALASYAARGGVIFITTPLVGDILERNAPGRTSWFYPPEHLHLVSPTGMKRFFESCGCVLLHQSRFELNPLRWSARYGVAAAESFAGAMIRLASPKVWSRLRDCRRAIGQQIGLWVFKKN